MIYLELCEIHSIFFKSAYKKYKVNDAVLSRNCEK